MNWLTDFVRPKIKAFIGNQQKSIPDDLWWKCPKCEQMIFHRELNNNLKVCPNCSYHVRLSSKERMNQLFDEQNYQLLPDPPYIEDPLEFKDLKKYKDRLKENMEKTGQKSAILAATGRICGQRIVLFVMNFAFIGGSMGAFVGQAFRRAVERTIKHNIPFVCVTASGGACMQEGIIALMQMPVTVISVEKLHEMRIPFITVLTDPTMGGVSASFAMLGDVSIAEEGALIGFAGPRVIEETIKQTLPSNFQRAEFLQKHGMIDIVTHRKDLKTKLGHVLACLQGVTTRTLSQ
ncbi:MAG: acetyl-CoA carboxylase, carboxyltransferase subunit beta [Holosporales bacterium]|jgi:acetyl-CoA carboxylase carboxyl transferase subunit beta|nr:acetyl-CoA carboxylase, carboxyltransferase subunit beta [Holosporales bacterium]